MLNTVTSLYCAGKCATNIHNCKMKITIFHSGKSFSQISCMEYTEFHIHAGKSMPRFSFLK